VCDNFLSQKIRVQKGFSVIELQRCLSAAADPPDPNLRQSNSEGNARTPMLVQFPPRLGPGMEPTKYQPRSISIAGAAPFIAFNDAKTAVLRISTSTAAPSYPATLDPDSRGQLIHGHHGPTDWPQRYQSRVIRFRRARVLMQ
jgi:hypothetical protein